MATRTALPTERPTIWTAGRSPQPGQTAHIGHMLPNHDKITELRAAMLTMQQQMQLLQQRLMTFSMWYAPAMSGTTPLESDRVSTVQPTVLVEQHQRVPRDRDLSNLNPSQLSTRTAIVEVPKTTPILFSLATPQPLDLRIRAQYHLMRTAHMSTMDGVTQVTRQNETHDRRIMNSPLMSASCTNATGQNISGRLCRNTVNSPTYSRREVLQHTVSTGATEVGPSVYPPGHAPRASDTRSLGQTVRKPWHGRQYKPRTMCCFTVQSPPQASII